MLSDTCAIAASFAGDAWLHASLILQIVLCVCVLFALVAVVLRSRAQKPHMHVNLKILLINVAVLYCAVAITYAAVLSWLLFRYWTYTEPCALLVPNWISITLRTPGFTYAFAFPLWHMAVTMERLWATLRPQRYERAGAIYGFFCALAIWVISIVYMYFVIALAYEDPDYQYGTSYPTLTTKTNTDFLVNKQAALLGIDLVTSAIDYLLIRINRRRLNSVVSDYNLGRSYQVNENVVVTMRLVFPLDVCNAVVFVAYLVLSSVARRVRPLIAPHTWNAIYEAIFNLMLMQALFSLVIFLRFIEKSKKHVAIIEQNKHQEVYFRQLQANWN